MKKHPLSQNKKELAIIEAQKMGETATPEKIAEVQEKLPKMKRGPVAKIWDKVLALWDAWRSPDTPMGTKVMIIGCLVYLVSPLDVIPDVLIGIGLLDDAAVLLWGYSMLDKLWKNGGKQSAAAVGGAVVGAAAGAAAGGVAGATAGLYNTDDTFKDKANKWIDEKIGIPVREFVGDVMKKELLSSRCRLVSNSLMNLVLYLFAVVLLLEPIFGVQASSCISALFLLIAFGFSVFRFVRAIRRVSPVIRTIFRKKSIRLGLAEHLRNQYYQISLVEKLGDKINIMGGEPSGHTLDKLIDLVLKGFFRDILRFVFVWAVLVCSFFIIRFSLLHVVANASFLQVVCYPFALAVDSLFHTNLLSTLGI